MRILLALAIGVAAVSSPSIAAPSNAAATNEDARFTAFGERIVDEFLKLDPVRATQLRHHRHDALLPDLSAKGRAARRAFAEQAPLASQYRMRTSAAASIRSMRSWCAISSIT